MSSAHARPLHWSPRGAAAVALVVELIGAAAVAAALLAGAGPRRWWALGLTLVAVAVGGLLLAASRPALPRRGTPSARRAAPPARGAAPGSAVPVLMAVAALATTALGGLQAAAPGVPGLLVPALALVPVFAVRCAPRRRRLPLDLYVVATAGWASWVSGVRGPALAGLVAVVAVTVVALDVVAARQPGPRPAGLPRAALRRLRSALAGLDPAEHSRRQWLDVVLDTGLPLVADVVPADRVAVYLFDDAGGRFDVVSEWERKDATPSRHRAEAERGAEMSEVLRSRAVLVEEELCLVPAGNVGDGELVMVIERDPDRPLAEQRCADAAELVGATFVGMTTRGLVAPTPDTADDRTDPLTGLASRRTLYDRIDIEMVRALRADSPLSVAMIDLDLFAAYNERFGTGAGDTVLRSIAAVIVSNVRDQDVVARFGGDEFCLIMPDTDITGGHHILDTLRAGGREATSDLAVTLSAGLTSWDGVEAASSLIERAEQALTRAKDSGRNRVVSIQAFTEF